MISFLYGFLDWIALQVHASKSMFSKISELFLMFYNFPFLFHLLRQKMPKQGEDIMPAVKTWKETTEQMKAIKETKVISESISRFTHLPRYANISISQLLEHSHLD